LIHISSPFSFGCLGDRFFVFSHASLDYHPPILGAYHRALVLSEMGVINFLLGLPSNGNSSGLSLPSS
jgi:hypothetical protein